MNKFDEMLRRDDLWFQIAITVAALVFFSVSIGTLIALFAGSTAAIGDRIDIIYKLGLIGAGVITFCTVVWRGLLATQQVDAQRKQLDRLAQQIAASEESTLADLLQRGAELLAETSKPAHVSAGIAILRSVAVSPKGLFAIEAMNLIADYIQEKWSNTHRSFHFDAAKAALAAGVKAGRSSDRVLTFEDSTGKIEWTVFEGVRFLRYRGGTVYGKHLERANASEINFRLIGVTVYGGSIDVTGDFMECHFLGTKIVSMAEMIFGGNTYKKCEFSGATIADMGDFPKDKSDENWFDPQRPPKYKDDFAWEEVLLTKQPASLF
ncbi:hypothetical protein [Mesorhizobium sp. SEMIA 3007]|uniref:hypothetical protein n=1 Tax=Mesorhizobium sp. SEMIA 3007 TaxID=1862350 RepID=UPI00114CFC58|nr:hypothetical protein [Mesorhizobium sp. SEMIA 3007]